MGPEPEYYILLKISNTRTRGYTSTGTFRLYPAHCRAPTISEGDKIIMTTVDLIVMMKRTQPKDILERKEWVSILKKSHKHLAKATISTSTTRHTAKGEQIPRTKSKQRTINFSGPNSTGRPTQNRENSPKKNKK